MKSTTLQIRLGKDRGDRILHKYLEQNKEGSSFTKEAKRLLIEYVLDILREQYGNNDLEELEIYKRFILNETNQEQIPSGRSDYQGRVDYQDLKWVNDNQEKHEKYGENENEEFHDDDDCNITDI